METIPTPTPEETAKVPANPLKLTLKVEEQEVQDHLRTFVRQSVEEALNEALSAEADALCGAKRYARSPDCPATTPDECWAGGTEDPQAAEADV
jgi:hypothetical protein